MNITLRKYLQDHRIKDLVLVAGGAGIDNQVTRVTVLDAPDGPSWLKGGELVLTSTFLFNNDTERLCTFCEQLINFKASCFGLKMGRYLVKVPQALIDLCDRNNFPLIIIPYSLVWTDLISVFYEMSYDLKREEKYSTLKSKLVNQIRSSVNLGLEWAGEKIYSFFEVPLLFLDKQGLPIASYGSESELACLKQEIELYPQKMIDSRNSMQIGGEYYFYCRCTLDRFGAYYVAFSSRSPNIVGELRDILVDADVIKEEEHIILSSEEELVGQIIPMLLQGERVPRRLLENMEQSLKQWGGYYCVLYVAPCAGPQLAEELEDAIKHLGFNIRLAVVYGIDKQRALFLLRFLKTQQHYDAAMELRQVMAKVTDYLGEEQSNERVFVSNIYDSYKKIEQCSKEAKLAEQYGTCIWEYRRLCYFEEIFPYYLMINSGLSPAYLDGIEKLARETTDTGFNCLQTLEAFLRCGSIKQAARELFIHENTLRYRIKKISEMICVDFDDVTVRQNYVIRINLWKLQHGLYGLGDHHFTKIEKQI